MDLCSRTGLVMLVHDQLDLTQRAIESILANTEDYLLVVVNNASGIGTHLMLATYQQSGKIQLVTMEKHCSFSKAVNFGICIALGAGCDPVMVLNNDIEMPPGWLPELKLAFHLGTNVGVVGPMMVTPEGIVWECGAFVDPDGSGWNRGRGLPANHPGLQEMTSVHYVSGAAMMVNREVFEAIGLLDEAFDPVFFEDTDFCFRARARGYDVVVYPAVKIKHVGSATLHSTDAVWKRDECFERNRKLFLQRWGDSLTQEIRA